MIQHFLRSGKLGDLCLGQSKDLVQMQLGVPEDYSRPNKKTEIWKYFNLQLTFDKDELCGISLYFDDGILQLPQALSNARLRAEHFQLHHFKDFLRSKHIVFSVDRDLTFDDQTTLRIAHSNVGVFFTKEQLHSMQKCKT